MKYEPSLSASNYVTSITKKGDVIIMERITLTASEVIDGKRVELGRQENFPVPETVDEVIGMSDLDDGCSDAEIVSCFVYGWKVLRQRQLRAGADPKKPVTIFKKINQAKQDEILEMARKAGLL